MKYRFEQRKGIVQIDRRIVDGFDPVQVESVTIQRRDGKEFRYVGCWDSVTVYGDSNRDGLLGRGGLVMGFCDLADWLRRHCLPSLQWIEDQVNELERSFAEDPMGYPGQYI